MYNIIYIIIHENMYRCYLIGYKKTELKIIIVSYIMYYLSFDFNFICFHIGT